MSIEFDTTGLTEALERVRLRVEAEGQRKALHNGGKVIADAIVERAPVLDAKTAHSTSLDPGALKGDIGVRMHSEDGEQYAYIGPGKLTRHVARWVELGHRDVHGGYSHGADEGKFRGPGVAGEEDVQAYPFIRPAYEASEEAALAEVAATLKLYIEEK
jgi:HK97 gp10 family phage protein